MYFLENIEISTFFACFFCGNVYNIGGKREKDRWQKVIDFLLAVVAGIIAGTALELLKTII